MACVRALSRACTRAATRRLRSQFGYDLYRWHAGGRLTPCASSSSMYGSIRHAHQNATGFTHRICVAALENPMSPREFCRGFAQQVDDAENDEADLSNNEAAEGVDDEFSSLWRKFETQKMGPGGSIQAIHEWQAQGNELTKTSLGRVLIRLNSRRLYYQAFEIMTWIAAEKLYDFNEKDYALHITVACRANRLNKAEEIFAALPAEMRTEGVEGAFIGGLAGRNMVYKVEHMLEELKLSSAQTYNMLMLMYLRENLDEKVLDVFEKMKKSGVEPNTFTYVVLLKHKDRLGGLEGIEEEAEAALNKISVEDAKLNQEVLSNMMVVYGYLGKLDKVEKIWSIIKQMSWVRSSSYLAAMVAFGKLGEVGKAEKIFEELLAAKINVQRPHAVMVEIYAELGLMDKAEEALAKLKELVPKPWFTAYNDLILGYLAKKQPDKALRKLQEAYEIKGRVRPDYRTMMAMLPVFASKKDVEGAEKLFKDFYYRGGPKIYNELLKVYIAAEASAGKFRRRMRGTRTEPNQETMDLLNKLKLITTAY